MIRRVNLLPEEHRLFNKRPLHIAFSFFFIFYISTLFLINHKQGVLLSTLKLQRDTFQKQSNDLSIEAQKYKATLDSLSMTIEKEKEIEGRIAAVKEISQKTIIWSDYLYELSNIIPKGVWMTRFLSLEPGPDKNPVKLLRINGMSLSSTAVTDLLVALEASPFFKNAALVYVRDAKYNGANVFSFEINLALAGK